MSAVGEGVPLSLLYYSYSCSYCRLRLRDPFLSMSLMTVLGPYFVIDGVENLRAFFLVVSVNALGPFFVVVGASPSPKHFYSLFTTY